MQTVEGGGLHLLHVEPGNRVAVFEAVFAARNVRGASVYGVHPAAFAAVFELGQTADSAYVQAVLAAFRADGKTCCAQGIVGGGAFFESGVGAARNAAIGCAAGNGHRNSNRVALTALPWFAELLLPFELLLLAEPLLLEFESLLLLPLLEELLLLLLLFP